MSAISLYNRYDRHCDHTCMYDGRLYGKWCSFNLFCEQDDRRTREIYIRSSQVLTKTPFLPREGFYRFRNVSKLTQQLIHFHITTSLIRVTVNGSTNNALRVYNTEFIYRSATERYWNRVLI